MLCQYKDIFGKQNEGLHSYRIANVAVVDVLLTIILAFLINRDNFYMVFLILIILSIIAHRLFCVKTTVDKFIKKYII